MKRSAKEVSKYPLMEEYDFKNDLVNPVLSIDLRPSTRIRVLEISNYNHKFHRNRYIVNQFVSLIKKNHCQRCLETVAQGILRLFPEREQH